MENDAEQWREVFTAIKGEALKSHCFGPRSSIEDLLNAHRFEKAQLFEQWLFNA